MVKLLKISDFMACGSFLLFMFRVCHAVVSCVFDTFHVVSWVRCGT